MSKPDNNYERIALILALAFFALTFLWARQADQCDQPEPWMCGDQR